MHPRQQGEGPSKRSPRKQKLARGLAPSSSRAVLKSVFPKDTKSKSSESPTGEGGNFPSCNNDGSTLRPKRKHSFLYSMLNPHSKSPQALVFKRCISTVILIDLVLFILSTDPRFEDALPYYEAEATVSIIFMLEYLLRLLTITESSKFNHPIGGRLAYMKTWHALIDLLATVPWFLEISTGWDLPTLTFIRFLRLVRILKTESYAKAMDTVYRVIYFNSEILYVGMLVCVYMIFFTALLLYYFRPDFGQNTDSQFNGIPATMYLSALMLTGQGGPEETDLPWYTRTVVLITSIFSVAMFAIPASMLTWGFEAEAERIAKQSRRRVLKKREAELRNSSRGSSCDEEENGFHSSSTSSRSDTSDGDTTDEEYFKLIAGEDEPSDDDDDSFVKKLKSEFQKADGDQDGTLTLKEFVRMNDNLKWSKNERNPSNFEERIRTLEENAQANAKKLDLILSLLQQK